MQGFYANELETHFGECLKLGLAVAGQVELLLCVVFEVVLVHLITGYYKGYYCYQPK